MSLNVKLDVNPFHDDLSDCIEECIITAAAYLRRNYVLMYSKAWGFSYREKDDGSNCICKRLDADREDVFELLSHYHGISMSLYMNEDPLEALGIIKRELAKKIPVTILMDTYYYSWDPNKNLHGKHAFLITGIDEGNKVLYCTDPYFSQINTPLEYEYFAQGYLGKLLTFSRTKSEIADFDWKNIINHTIWKLEGKNGGLSAFDNMLKFADDIENYFCMEAEMGSYDRIVDIPYYTQIYNPYLEAGNNLQKCWIILLLSMVSGICCLYL